ncbi:Conserved_hypothetical protein [Hexamita inflata]|uniref:Uncharacterized protein n=1 Tax=Hexamita inflata TaxID=28002 RepID=A0AA86URX1_9EUKA|nr:Conserved hypothetical protein [Hexamita inflata]
MIETASVQDQNLSQYNIQTSDIKDNIILSISKHNSTDTLTVGSQDDLRKLQPESNAKPSKKPKRSNVISLRLSYWINIQRCLMCIIVIVSHITPKSYDEQSIATALIPHPFVANGRSCVRVFFSFAAIFSMQSMLGLYEKHKNSAKDFTKAFLFQYIKRYFSTHAVLLVFGLGYAPFLYYVFGENSRVTTTGEIRRFVTGYYGISPFIYHSDLLTPSILVSLVGLVSSQQILSSSFTAFIISDTFSKRCLSTKESGVQVIFLLLPLQLVCFRYSFQDAETCAIIALELRAIQSD